MLLMPIDDELLGPSNGSCNVIAQMMGEDFLNNNADLMEFINEAGKLLTAVDAAISQANLVNDQQWEKMRTSWCFFGPGILKQIEAIKTAASLPRLNQHSKSMLYAKVAFIQTFLTIRRQTLELNEIEVLE